MKFSHRIECFLRPHGKKAFIANISENSRILDVGCGNLSPIIAKDLSDSCYYVGIDIVDYNQSDESKAVMDEYFVVSPVNFAEGITDLDSKFDLVISSHNLEHCFERWEVLDAMLNKVEVNGLLYLSFPSEASTQFPSRQSGCLNYFDDDTHHGEPPNLHRIIEFIEKRDGFEIIFLAKNYSPKLLKMIGFIFEPLSRLTKKTKTGTWELYGFETIVHIKRVC